MPVACIVIFVQISYSITFCKTLLIVGNGLVLSCNGDIADDFDNYFANITYVLIRNKVLLHWF